MHPILRGLTQADVAGLRTLAVLRRVVQAAEQRALLREEIGAILSAFDELEELAIADARRRNAG